MKMKAPFCQIADDDETTETFRSACSFYSLFPLPVLLGMERDLLGLQFSDHLVDPVNSELIIDR